MTRIDVIGRKRLMAITQREKNRAADHVRPERRSVLL